ncbi:polymorphic toxin type 50 domain-containing protein [Anaeromicropila populeti]|uniref:Toxin 50 n=1 Tax=Anaeromicropila populeti TaxID=37658 RepID=A0A1I6L3B9_9FIRM|nr:polymorphic toxin type 50 domain-containing protein [Anaeromicropila populeti]SFR97778.1 toxin 50 [Anaeromicropila populeti]
MTTYPSHNKVNVGQQEKHIPGTNNYKNEIAKGKVKSIIKGDANDVQRLLDEKAGTGTMIGNNKERVNFGEVIGQYVDPNTGIATDTTVGIIHYGKNGAHIVPARPK